MAAPLLKIERLRVDFPEVVAVDDLSFELEPCDLCGLVGSAGSGTTTVLRAAAGLQKFSCGSVWIAGHDLAHEPTEAKRRVGFMPALPPMYEQLSATEFLDHFASAYDLPERARRIEHCLELVWLTAHSRTRCGELSRGMQQRLNLARILLPNPPVLLLDDPVSALDPLERIDFWKLLLQLRDAGKALMISSHQLGEMTSFCNKAAILSHGRLLAFGTIAEVARQLGRRRISVKWPEDETRAAQILDTLPGVMDLIQAGQGATFDLEGGSDEAHEVLRQLILHEVRVTEWRSLESEREAPRPQPGRNV